MADYINSIKVILYDRAVSPLFGMFVVSWVGWNYKFFLVLFSSMEAEGKISYIQYVLYGEDFQRFGIGLLFPTLTTLAAIYCYPLISIPVYKEFRKRQKELRAIKQSYADLQLLDEKESRALIRRGLDQEREFDIALKAKEDELIRFKALNADLIKEIAELKENVARPIEDSQSRDKPDYGIASDLTDTQIKMMNIIGNDSNAVDLDLFESHGQGKMYAEYDLDVLLNRGYVAAKGRGFTKDKKHSGNVYVLTPSGREFIVRNERM